MADRNRYEQLILSIFERYYKNGVTQFEFARVEIEEVAKELEIELPKNIGDVIYSFRYRNQLPGEIIATASADKEWIIEGAGRARYQFRLTKLNRIVPRTDLVAIKIPDATPEILGLYSLDDEQALLAKVRYNRMIDLFLELNAYSLQNHLRTTVKDVGQIEIDELYVGVDKFGRHHIIPVQAKGGTDQISPVQAGQDIKWCQQKFPSLRSRAISAQFMTDDVIAIFELGLDGEDIKVVEEKHYRLVAASEIDAAEIVRY